MSKRLSRVLGGAVVLAGCSGAPGADAPPPLTRDRPAVAQPDCDQTLTPADDLSGTVANADAGTVLCLAAGTYRGPLEIGVGVTLWGPAAAVIRSAGQGTTVRVEADGAQVLGLTIDGSGSRFDLLDAAMRVEGDDVRIEGVSIRNATFGFLVEKSERVILRDNEVLGQSDLALGLRGDAIRLWETRHSTIEGNRVHSGRDVVVWYSSNNVISGNHVEGGRYGTHFMYSHDNRVESNVYRSNVVGIFVMYSRNLGIRDNLMLDSNGAAGVGLGIKESGNLSVVDNRFVRNTVGAYLDTSPLDLTDTNVFRGNLFALGDTGVTFHASPARNTFHCNQFQANVQPVAVEGQGDAQGIDWSHNRFDDYAGYDLDDDGTGDLEYRLESHTSRLVDRAPALGLLRGTPAFSMIDMLGRLAPLFEPRLVLVDPVPWMSGPCPIGEVRLEG